MTPADLLRMLLERLAEGKEESLHFSTFDTTPWPDGTLERLVDVGLLQEGQQAETVACDGCEEYCIRPVHVRLSPVDKSPAVFVACDQRDDVGRVAIKPGQLRQWRFGPDLMAMVLNRLLDISETPSRRQPGLWRLGRAQFNGQPQVCFLALSEEAANGETSPGAIVFLPSETGDKVLIPSVLFLDESGLHIDRTALEGLCPVRHTRTEVEAENLFLREEGTWLIRFGGESCRLSDTVGLGYIHYLLQHPKQDIPVTQLRFAVRPPTPEGLRDDQQPGSSASLQGEGIHSEDEAGDDLMDGKGLRQIREEQKRLTRQKEEATKKRNKNLAKTLEDKISQIQEYLDTTVGLKGRPRQTATASSKNADSVRKALRRAEEKISATCPNLGTHLYNAIHPGSSCHYTPEKDIDWTC